LNIKYPHQSLIPSQVFYDQRHVSFAVMPMVGLLRGSLG